MVVPLGISVGDFIAVIQVLRDIAAALDEHSGAQAQYQQTIRNLETVKAILSQLECFTSASGQSTLISAIRAQAQAIHNEVQTFINGVQKFRITLGPGVPPSKRHGILDKLKWSKKHAKKAEVLNASVAMQLRNIQVLLDLDLRYSNKHYRLYVGLPLPAKEAMRLCCSKRRLLLNYLICPHDTSSTRQFLKVSMQHC
jgi:ABC-type multidrug transport system fused ATPase/permease subunit